jgi:hypothetical protein
MGNSTDVPLVQRVSAWVEIVPRLLAHLDIQHVSLASHSAGTIYLLNTLYYCRDILRPDKPMVTLLGARRLLQKQLRSLSPISQIDGHHEI